MAVSTSSALPTDQSIAQRTKRSKRGSGTSSRVDPAIITISPPSINGDNNTLRTSSSFSSDSASASASASAESLLSVLSSVSDAGSIASNDFIGKLKKSDSQPSLGNDFLTAHKVFGDYIRKHEIPRKVLHSSIGLLTLYLYTVGAQQESFPFGFHIAFVFVFLVDLFRLNSKRFNYVYCQVLGFLMREKEVHSYNGVLWYILGIDFAFSFFTKDIAALSVLLLSWSDTAASTCGRAWGHLTPKIARNKSLAGSIAAFAVGVFSVYLFYGYFVPGWNQFNRPGDIYWTPETSYLNLHALALLGGFIAALSEGIDLFNWDDNFTIPVLSSIFFYGLITVFHK